MYAIVNLSNYAVNILKIAIETKRTMISTNKKISNSQDTSLSSTSMTMIITVVPPVGPPIPTIVGKAIKINQDQDYQVYLDEKLDRDGVYFETEDLTMIFPNGTIIYQ